MRLQDVRNSSKKKCYNCVNFYKYKVVCRFMGFKVKDHYFKKAKKEMDDVTIEVKTFKEFEKAIKDKKRCLVPWTEDEKSEDEIKEKTGAKSSCIPFEFEKKSLKGVKCFYSGKPATAWTYFCKSH